MKHLLMIEFTNDKVADFVEPDARSVFGVTTEVVKAKVPRLRTRGWQVSADDLLSEVCRLRIDRQVDYAVGLTSEDMFVPDMNFVFGLASSDGKCAVVSTNRLKSGDPQLFRERLSKELVHEMGHVVGLEHCPDANCVMHFSNTLQDTDAKSKAPCSRCSERLSHLIGT